MPLPVTSTGTDLTYLLYRQDLAIELAIRLGLHLSLMGWPRPLDEVMDLL